jgi:GT2 family glycosyltransferase
MTMPVAPTVSAVVLAWKDEPWLARSIEALLASQGVTVDVIIVDNGCTNDGIDRFVDHKQVTVLRPGTNLGYSGGNNVGAEVATGEYLALVNSDLVVEPTTLRQLVDVAADPTVGLVVASVRLSEDPRLINAGANPVHVLGLSWSGDMGQPETRAEPVETAGASGACVLTRTAHWRRLGGFDAEYFAYHEDVELSLRTWWRGLRVMYVPAAVGVHRYEFSRVPFKMYLSERNRLLLLATGWSGRALVLLSPALIGLELAMLLVAARQGWAREKARGWAWLWRNRRHVSSRRRQLRGEQLVSDREWMGRLHTGVDKAFFPLPFGLGAMSAIMRGYWSVVRRLI